MKTIIITGASSGFGFDASTALSDRGDQVIAASRRSDPKLDLLDPASIEAFAAEMHRRFPEGIDALVNNAGIGIYGPFEQVPMTALRQQLEVNFFGAVDLTQRLLPLLERKKGALVQISSVLGFYGLGYTSAYVASKFALTGWTESVRTELNHKGIRVSLIEPGSFSTGFSASVQWMGMDQAAMKAYRAHHDSKSRNSDAREVSRAVIRGIDSQCPFQRIRCGREPKLLRFAMRILPERIYYAFLNRMERRLFRF